MLLLPGDVVLAQPTGLLGSIVVRFQAFFGDPVEYSHVGMVSRAGRTGAANPFEEPWVTEALAHVETAPMSKNWTGRKYKIYRHRSVSLEQREELGRKAEEYTGRPYGWWKLLLIGIDAYLSKKFQRNMRVFSQLIHREGAPICSFLVQDVYNDVLGIGFGVPRGSAQPDDIADHCANSPDWMEILPAA